VLGACTGSVIIDSLPISGSRAYPLHFLVYRCTSGETMHDASKISADRTACTQYGRLLAWYWRRTSNVRPSLCMTATLSIVP